MTREDVEARYTEIVRQKITEGYIILGRQYSSSETMWHLEMYKSQELIRVEVVRYHKYIDYKPEDHWALQIQHRDIAVTGIKHVRDYYEIGFDWCEELAKFYIISDGYHNRNGEMWFTEEREELVEANQKRRDRADYRCDSYKVIKSETAKTIALSYVKKQKEFKTCQLQDIEQILKDVKKNCYIIQARGKSVKLQAMA